MENFDDLQYIELSDGTETVKLLLMDTFGVEDKDYAALLDEEENQLYILELETEGEEVIFKAIEDEKEFEEILSIYEELIEDDEEE